jgi:hypothetical protein
MRLICFGCLLLVGCGQGESTQPAASAGPGAKTVSSLADESCPGFTLIGLKYSPGGHVLPHTCKPFDAVTNNPYAVRCVDAMPAYKTPYPGDEFCILPPPPDQGVQVGVHPQGDAYWDKMYASDYSDYANEAITRASELAGGSEVVQNFDTTATNQAAHNYFRLDSRMRDGSHHLVSWFNSKPVPNGWEKLTRNEQSGIGTEPMFYNVQTTHSDRPSAVALAPEDEGLGASFSARASVGFQLHHINPGTAPILREVWINIWWLPDGKTTTPVRPSVVTAQIDYPPNKVFDNTSTAVASGDTRIVSVFGHRHAWTPRFSAQIIRANGDTEELYDSFNWAEMPTFQLDSLTTNPPARIAQQIDGAKSGLTILHKGDKVQFACHVDTTAAQAQKLGVPVPTANLHFDNEAIGAEMCVLYLETTGPGLAGGAAL